MTKFKQQVEAGRAGGLANYKNNGAIGMSRYGKLGAKKRWENERRNKAVASTTPAENTGSTVSQ